MTKIEKLLLDLLNIPSVSGDEKNIGEFLCKQLVGFKIQKQKISKDRFNIIAKKGKPRFYIVVHMDTVPGDVSVKVTKQRIYGRGAIDNKGNIAGAIMAARKLDNVGLIFTVGEEVGCEGAKKVRVKSDKFIVMEPTKLQVGTAQRGVVAWTVTAKGKQMHSSLQFKKTDSAVYVLNDFLHKLFKKNWTAFNVHITNGGIADNIVPALAVADVTMRPKTEKEFKEIVQFAKRHRNKNVKITSYIETLPCKSTLIKKGISVPFFSEMAFFPNSVLFGVGNIEQAHTPNEYVVRKDLNRLEGELLRLIKEIQ